MKIRLRSILLTSILIAGLGFNFAPPAFAITAQEQARCDRINARIDNHIARFDAAKERHFTRYHSVKDRIKARLDRLDSKGYNTQQARIDLKTFDDKIKHTERNYAIVIDKLNTAKTFTCGQSQGQFKQAIKDAKAQLDIVRADVTDMKNYWHDTLKVDIQNLRAQKGNITPVASSSASPTTTQ